MKDSTARLRSRLARLEKPQTGIGIWDVLLHGADPDDLNAEDKETFRRTLEDASRPVVDTVALRIEAILAEQEKLARERT